MFQGRPGPAPCSGVPTAPPSIRAAGEPPGDTASPDDPWPPFHFRSALPRGPHRPSLAGRAARARAQPGERVWHRERALAAGSAPDTESGSTSPWLLVHGKMSTKRAARRPQCLPRSTDTALRSMLSVHRSHSETLQGRSRAPTLSPTTFMSWGLAAPHNAKLQVQELIIRSKYGKDDLTKGLL